MAANNTTPRVRAYEYKPLPVAHAAHHIHAGEYTASGVWLWERPATPLFEMFVLAEGKVRLAVDGHALAVEAGDFVCLAPGESYTIEKTSRRNSIFRFVKFAAGATGYLREWPSWRDAPYQTRERHAAYFAALAETLVLPEHLSLPPRSHFIEQHDWLMQLEREQPPGFVCEMYARLISLLADVSRRFLVAVADSKQAGKSPANSASRHLDRAMRYIETHLGDPISLHDVAVALSLSSDYLGRIFQEFAGEPIGAFILQRKIAIAKARLLVGDRSIKEIASDLGFSDPRYFSRRFQQIEGLSPSAYIQTHRRYWPGE